jgi:flagellar hook-associated protein 1 FlgK
LQDVTWLDEGGNAYVINDTISSGTLGACLEVRDELIPAYQAQLDTLAVAMMEAVNTLHATGYDLNGDAGLAFFTGTGAADLAVNSEILNDTDLIAASSSADDADGDATIATAIAELQSSLALDSGTSTFSDYYDALVSKVGAAVSTADAREETATDTLTTYQNLRDSVSGVSTDEELTKLILYQSAYEAAAKVMTTLDEMMQTMLEM